MSETWLSPVWNESRVRVPDVDTRGGGVAAAAAIAGRHAAATAAASIAARRAPSMRRRRSSRPRWGPHPPVISLRRRTILDRRGAIEARGAHRTVRRRPQVGKR